MIENNKKKEPKKRQQPKFAGFHIVPTQ